MLSTFLTAHYKLCILECDSIRDEGISKQDLQTRIWDSLRDQYGLTCAHLNVQGVYSGCILDYLRESRCPGAIEDKSDN